MDLKFVGHSIKAETLLLTINGFPIRMYSKFGQMAKICQKMVNGPYSLLIRASYFIFCSVYARSTSIIFIVCKWR